MHRSNAVHNFADPTAFHGSIYLHFNVDTDRGFEVVVAVEADVGLDNRHEALVLANQGVPDIVHVHRAVPNGRKE